MAGPTDRGGPTPTPPQDLADGSWLAHLQQTHSAAARAAEPMLVRVVDYTIDDGRDNPATYRLFTTLTDPEQASAVDLAAAYNQRWEIELTFDELKTHQRGPRTVLRSKSPDLVLQEIWGHLCCHYAIRSLMAEAARAFRPRPRPDELRRRAADQSPNPRPLGRFSPLTSTDATAPDGSTSYADYYAGSTPHAAAARHPASSNASTSSGTSSVPTTRAGRSQQAHGPTPQSALTERY